MGRINSLNAPPQRLPWSKKTKEWRKENLDSADKHSFYHNESVRQSLRNKIINLNLYNGLVNIKDLTDVVNPFHMDASFIPDNIPHHPIAVPKINLLVGEESKRRFDWKFVVSNPDAVSAKEEQRHKALMERLVGFVNANYLDEEAEKKLQELEKWLKYDWQDMRERMANQIVRHYYKEQNFQDIFLKGFKDALIMGEEIYQIDIVHDEPLLQKLNPLKVHSVRSGNSDRIEDSSIIIIEDHWSPGRIVDTFYEELKPEDIDYILEYTTTKSSGSYADDHNNHVLLRDSLEGVEHHHLYENLFSIAEINGHYFGSDFTDENGNIRVFRCYWKSLKKVKKVKFYDEIGEVDYKIMSEEYVPNKEMGEEATSLWVNEWWEGTKIGKDIYLQMRPRPVQFNKFNNPSYCHPGIVGQIYNTNQSRAVSLMDRMKNYQYMYDVIWDRLNKAIATNYGKIFELDLAKVPANWEIEKWLHFAIVNKIAVIDSFKEGTQGAATGKLAGGMNTQGGRAIDMETGAYIQQHIQLLEYIKNEMSEIAGVTKQREGAIHQNETASGVERSVNQSSHITEYWFHQHEQVKLRVLECFLESAKVALKGNNKKVQNILDDESIQIINIDGDAISDIDYGVVCTSSSKAQELEMFLKQNAQAYMQNGGSFTSLMDIYFSPSLADMRRKLEIAEEEAYARNSKQAEEANKLAQQAQADAKALEDAKLMLEDVMNQRDNETKIYIAELGLLNKEPEGDGIIDPMEQKKFDLDVKKQKEELMIKMKTLDQDMKKHKDNVKLKEKQLAKKPATSAS